MIANSPATEQAPAEIVLTRVLDAPRDLVFRMWSDPKHLAEWWGPDGFSVPVCEIDLRPGGALRLQMRAPDGSIYPMVGIFTEVVVPERLAFATKVGANEYLTTVTFAEENGRTRLTLVTQLTKGLARSLANSERGWTQALARLGEHLGSVENREAAR